jgi:1-acyl-sn-glycerol-3-phosphate acyltransferase
MAVKHLGQIFFRTIEGRSSDKGTCDGFRFFLACLILNLCYYPLFLAWTFLALPLAPAAYLACRPFSSKSPASLVRLMIWIYGRGWLYIISIFIPVAKETGAREDYKQPCILVGNHQSITDLYCVAAFPHHNVAFVVRSWPFKIPCFGPYMRRGEYINTDKLNSQEIFERAKSLFSEGTSVMFFPEGTRSRDGSLGRFHSGAFRLSLLTGIPIAPLCFLGSGVLLPRGSLWLRPASLTIKMLAPVYPETFSGQDLGHIAMRKRVKRLMAEEIERARRDSKGPRST